MRFWSMELLCGEKVIIVKISVCVCVGEKRIGLYFDCIHAHIQYKKSLT